MFYDLNKNTKPDLAEQYDVVIAGAGPAGITVAQKMASYGKRVLLCEGGGTEAEAESQELYAGKVSGFEYYSLDVTRLRYFGGTTNHWSGWCIEMDDHDFGVKDHIKWSGWPISKKDLDPYAAEASKVLNLPKPPRIVKRPLDKFEGFAQFEYQHSFRGIFLSKYLDPVKENKNIDLLLYANLVDISIDQDNGKVTEYTIRSLNGKNEFKVKGKAYVLAMGGLETARMLLNSNKQIEAGIGNQNDLVGRFFMDHFHLKPGKYISGRSAPHWGKKQTFFVPTADYINKTKLGNVAIRLLDYKATWSKTIKSFICDYDVLQDLLQATRGKKVSCYRVDDVAELGDIEIEGEQLPNPSSRVMLSDKKDRFGLRQIDLHWKVTDMDKKILHDHLISFAKQCAAQNYARLKMHDWFFKMNTLSDSEMAAELVGRHHHMGTTRMAASAQQGVVDKDCQVFNHDNLFVASSSVFSTSGHSNPTYSIVQLALRLSDHINKKL